jgi:glutamyl-Q tRNA(Asp) synthetase
VPAGEIQVEDRLQGRLVQDVEATVGDFVLRRRDGYASYQLAVTVDDAAHGVTDVVRGLDLWPQTPRQVRLQEALGLARPRYLHVPLVVEPDGSKLAKSRRSPAIEANAGFQLEALLALIRHPPPDPLRGAPVAELLGWAVGAWDVARLRGSQSLDAGEFIAASQQDA